MVFVFCVVCVDLFVCGFGFVVDLVVVDVCVVFGVVFVDCYFEY